MEPELFDRCYQRNYPRLYWQRKCEPKSNQHQIEQANYTFLCHQESLAEDMKEFKCWSAVVAIYSSNFIEEAGLPLNETQELLRSHNSIEEEILLQQALSRGDHRLRDVVLHAAAYRFLCEHHLREPLTVELILDTHKILMTGAVREDGFVINAGQFRTTPITVGRSGQPCINPSRIGSHMAALVAAYNERRSTWDPFLLASWLKNVFVHIHPFEDGNGRLSRLLLNWSLMSSGLPFPISLLIGFTRKAKANYFRCVANSPWHGRFDGHDIPALNSLILEAVSAHWCSFFERIRFKYLATVSITWGPKEQYLPLPWRNSPAYKEKTPSTLLAEIGGIQALYNSSKDPQLEEAITSTRNRNAVSAVAFSRRPIHSSLVRGQLQKKLEPILFQDPSTTSSEPGSDVHRDLKNAIGDIQGIIEPHPATRTAEEMVCHALAYRSLCVEGVGSPLSVDLIVSTHRLLCPQADGKLRDKDAYIGAHLFPDSGGIKGALDNLVATFIQKQRDLKEDDEPPYHLAAWLMYELLAIHPFLDGNGRLTRLFLNWVLLSHGLPFPISFEEASSTKGWHRHLMKTVLSARLAAGVPSVLATRVLVAVHHSWLSVSLLVPGGLLSPSFNTS